MGHGTPGACDSSRTRDPDIVISPRFFNVLESALLIQLTLKMSIASEFTLFIGFYCSRLTNHSWWWLSVLTYVLTVAHQFSVSVSLAWSLCTQL